MKLKYFLESEDTNNPPKQKLSEIMKDFKSVIERYERDGEIHRDDRAKIETLKDMISHMVKVQQRREEN